MQNFTTFETRNGHVAIAWQAERITGLRLPASTQAQARSSILRRCPDATFATPPAFVAEVIEKIVRYFEGEQMDFADVPIDLGIQDPFFADVYTQIRKLRWGETTTYGAVARTLGAEPQAAQEVGRAMATNPIPLIVPCHRVLAAGKKIGGFSAPGGSESKVKMLLIEGVPVPLAEERRGRDERKAVGAIQKGFQF